MKAQMTKQEALIVLNDARNKWPNSETFFRREINKILDLPNTTIVVLDDYILSEIHRQPHPYEGETVVNKDGLKGKTVYLSWAGSILIKWQDHKWYKPHLTEHVSYDFIIDESREFWRIKNES